MRSPSDIDELVQAEIDGCATDEQRAALAARLARDPAARDEARRIRALAETLDRLEPVAAPPEMVDAIMRSIRSEPKAGPRGLWSRLRAGWPSGRFVLPYAYAAAAGAALCFVALQALGGALPFVRPIHPGDAVGTIGAGAGSPLQTLDLAAAGVPGTATVRAVDGRTALDVEIGGSVPVDVGVAFDPAAAEFLGIADRTSGLEHVVVEPGAVRWSQAPGRGVTVLLASRGSAEANVRVGIDGAGGRREAGVVRLPSSGRK